MSAWHPGARQRWAVFAFALFFVTGFDALWSGVRYPYAADSASYIEMAQTLREDGRPRVTPWDFAEGSADRIPQKLFPPGYPLLVAAVTPLTGTARTAALIPGRVAAVLIPVLLVTLFAGAVPARALMLLSVYTLLTGGVRGWQYAAYSDVPALAVSIVALGALARGLRLVGEPRYPLRWCLLAGLAAGLAYTIRNAGIAVLAIAVVALAESVWRRRTWRELAAVMAGAAGPLAALFAYNLTTFGRWQPYAMPASTRAWPLNAVDWAAATLTDLGVPWQVAGQLPHPVAVLAVGSAVALVVAAWVRLRTDPPRRALLLLVGGYALGGAVLLVLSRSRYEWGNLIDERNTLQYTWALVFAVVMAVPALFTARVSAPLGRLGAVAVLAVFCCAAVDAWRVGTAPVEPWQRLADDPAVLAAALAPPGTLVVSNQAVLFRIGRGVPVRNLEIDGDDRSLWRAMEDVRAHAAGRDGRLIVVCDEYTAGYSACGGVPVAGVSPPPCAPARLVAPRVTVCPVPAVAAHP